MSHPQIHWNPLKMQKIKLIYQIQILQILAEKVWGTFSKNRGLLIEEIPKPSEGGGGGFINTILALYITCCTSKSSNILDAL